MNKLLIVLVILLISSIFTTILYKVNKNLVEKYQTINPLELEQNRKQSVLDKIYEIADRNNHTIPPYINLSSRFIDLEHHLSFLQNKFMSTGQKCMSDYVTDETNLDSRLVCPEHTPICAEYKNGVQWGECEKEDTCNELQFCKKGQMSQDKRICCPSTGCSNVNTNVTCKSPDEVNCIIPDKYILNNGKKCVRKGLNQIEYCVNGIKSPNGNICCAKSCGKCESRACIRRIGGAKACCPNQIEVACASSENVACRIPPPSEDKIDDNVPAFVKSPNTVQMETSRFDSLSGATKFSEPNSANNTLARPNWANNRQTENTASNLDVYKMSLVELTDLNNMCDSCCDSSNIEYSACNSCCYTDDGYYASVFNTPLAESQTTTKTPE